MHRYAICLALLAAPASAQLSRAGPQAAEARPAEAETVDQAIADRMMADVQPIRLARIVLWADPAMLPAEAAHDFAIELEKGVLAIEQLTGETVDSAHYGGSAVQVFVSGRVTVSHVYGGYAHARFDRPYLYLNPRRVTSRTAPYLHELTHIVLWRFGSHSLREGFASYVEGRLAGQSVGYNSGVFGPGPAAEVDAAAAEALKTEAGAGVLPWIGRSGGTDKAVTSADNPDSRAAFYLLTRSFVQHLLEHMDMPTFVRLYRAEDTEAAYREMTGRSLDDWLASWRASLRN